MIYGIFFLFYAVIIFAKRAFNVSIKIDLPEPVWPVKTVNPLSKSISKFPKRAILLKRRLLSIVENNRKDANKS